MDEGTEQPLHHIVRGVVVGPGEILLQDVGHDVVNSRHHLVFGYRVGKDWVQNGEPGKGVVLKEPADLPLGLRVGDHRPAVHLRPGAHHGEHAAHGENPVVHRLLPKKIFFPGVLSAPGGDGHRLGVVAHRTAAHSQDQVRAALPGQPAALGELVCRGVGHHPWVLHDLLAAGADNVHNLVIDAVSFDGPAAIDQQHGLAPGFQLPAQIIQGVLAEIQPGGVGIGEITQHGKGLLSVERFIKSGILTFCASRPDFIRRDPLNRAIFRLLPPLRGPAARLFCPALRRSR